MRRALLLALVVAALAACGASSSVSFTRVSPQQFAVATASGSAVVLDVRTPEEAAAGVIAGAMVIDFYAADFERRLGELDRDVAYLLYCRTSSRSGSVVRLMKDLGFKDVTELDGGIEAWVAGGFPVVTN